MRRSIRVLAVGFALSAALGAGAACGDDGGSAADAAGRDCATGSGETVTVEIGDFTYAPDPVRVHRCDQVVWHNAHDQAHTSSADADARWTTGNLEPGATSDPVPFDEAGTYAYHCALHPFMQAAVQVT